MYNGQIKDIKRFKILTEKLMDNSKDIQKTSLNSYGQVDVSSVKSLQNNSFYNHSNKKTEKLVTALYMVTDCMETDDALKGKLRLLGVELLSNMHNILTANPLGKNVHIESSLARVNEIISFIEIAYTIGYISEMNTSILKREFIKLTKDLDSYQSKDKHFTFTLDEKMFIEENNNVDSSEAVINKDISIGQISKRTPLNNLSFRKDNNASPILSPIKKVTTFGLPSLGKEERSHKILALIKDKKDISIKDISTAFTDCSEKTIQRELATLVSKGQIKKIGEKRWSRYQALA